jgi:hypothetical protein
MGHDEVEAILSLKKLLHPAEEGVIHLEHDLFFE